MAACLTLQGSLSTPPALASENRWTQILFSCILQELWVKNEMHLQSVTGQERAVGSMAVSYFLVSSYTCSLALLWLCFVSTLYGHGNETSHIFKYQNISNKDSWLLILHFTSDTAAFFPDTVMPACSRSSQKCSNLILLGCIFNSPNIFTLLNFHICV